MTRPQHASNAGTLSRVSAAASEFHSATADLFVGILRREVAETKITSVSGISVIRTIRTRPSQTHGLDYRTYRAYAECPSLFTAYSTHSAAFRSSAIRTSVRFGEKSCSTGRSDEPSERYRMRSVNSIPSAPKAAPLLGHAIPLLRDPTRFLTSLPTTESLIRIRIGPARIVLACDPATVRQLLRDDRTFDKGGPIYDRIREVLRDSLASCPYDAHRRQRRLAQPAFRSDRLPRYAETMTECIVDVIDSWPDDEPLNLLTEMMTITSRVTAATLLSNTLPTGLLDRLLADVTTLFDGFYLRTFLPPPLDRLPTAGNLSYRRAHARLRRTVDDIIAQRRRTPDDHGDLLSALMTARDDEHDGGGMSDEEITDTIIAFFLAGTETTATTLAWALYLLARNPEVEHRLHAEVDAVLTERTAHYTDLHRLPLTERVITEALRVYSPAWLSMRVVTDATTLGGYTLPVGTTVAYSPYLIHHRADVFPQPEIFDPGRWDPDVAHPPLENFLPFGGGARKCIGDRFGMTEATLTLATIASRWRLRLSTDREVTPATGLLLRPRNLLMTPSPRQTTPIHPVEKAER
ncbi:cytochrome P450 [Nocardia sp. CC201C]|uniref:cytochrome P450 n=1 Tax=Nocardia sp. CC201C TaxID=3044575 RepID=UPI0024A7F2A9|nr:cytochrome P450 [Nocardia sp. CC201C]